MTATNDWLKGVSQSAGAKVGMALVYDEQKPETLAENMRVGAELGIPANVVGAEPDAFKKRAELKRTTAALTDAPKTSAWLANSENGTLAKDDVENLSWFEKNVVQSPGAITRSVGRGIVAMGAIPFESTARVAAQRLQDQGKTFEDIYAEELAKIGGESASATTKVTAMQIAQIRADRVAGMSDADRADVIRRGAAALSEARSILDSAADIPMNESGAKFRDVTLANADDSLLGTLKAFAEDPAGGISFIIQTAAEVLPILAASTAATVVTRSPSVGVGVMAGGSFLIENSNSAMEFLAEKGVDLSTPEAAALVLDNPELMREAADRGLTRGIIIAIFDAASGGVAGQTLSKSPMGEVVVQGLAQMFFGSAGEATAQVASGQDFSWQDVVIEGLAELVTAPLEVVGVAGRGALRNLARATEAGSTSEVIDQLDEMASKSKLKQRSAEKFFEAIDAQGQADFYVSADDLREYFQANDLVGEDVLTAWGIDPSEFEIAESSGGDVAVSRATFAAHIAGTDDVAWFKDNATRGDGEMSVSQAARFNAEVRDVMSAALADVEARRAADLEMRASDVKVYDSIFSQLREAGRTRDVAANEARVWASFWRTMGERYGADPLDLAQSMGVRIQGPQTPDVARRRDQVDVMLNTLRSKGEKALAPRGSGILEFVRGQGGIRDRGGDLEALDVPKGVIAESRSQILERESQPSMVGADMSGRGKGLDEIGRAMIEAGYFPEYMGGADIQSDGTVVDEAAIALEAISEAVTGRDRFIAGEGPDQDLSDFADLLRERGIDLAMSNDEIVAALQDDPDGQQYDQDGRLLTDTPEFRAWFGDSKVVDENGDPLVVYHGTNQEIDVFDMSRGGASTGTNAGATKAFFFTDSMDVAQQYAEQAGKRVIAGVAAYEKETARLQKEVTRLEKAANRTGDWDSYERAMEAWEEHEINALYADDAVGQNTVETYLSIQNPMIVEFEGGRLSAERDLEILIDEARAAGHDGLILRALEDSPQMGLVSDQYVAFDPTQIKSVHNRGTFDANDPRILYQDAGKKKGVIKFPLDKTGSVNLKKGQTVINLFESADLSTFLHESGHFFLEASMNLVSRPDAPLPMRNDMTAILRWLDVPASNGGAPQTIINRLQLHSKTLGNLTVGKSGLSEGEGGVSVETLLPMVIDMRRAVSDAKVLDAVIRALPVDVMDMLGGSEGAAKVALHDEAVLKSIFTSAAIKKENVSVPVDEALLSRQVDLLGKTLGVIADTAAKMTSVPLGPTGAEASEGSASVAGNIGHDDFDALMEGWGQLSSDEKTKRHEQWARGSEAYFMEGKAPSLELADAFARFKAWLTRIYRSISGLNVKLTPEIREVMDRMLATDAEIKSAYDMQQVSPLFTDMAASGMSDAAWATYQKMARRSEEQASQALLERTMEKVRREKEKWWKDERAQVRQEVSGVINSKPEYRLIEMLANQRWIGSESEVPDFQLDRKELVETFGDGVLAELSRNRFGGKRAIYGSDGVSLHEAADFFGFANSSQMIETLQNTGKMRDAIEIETDRIMSDRYGDPLNDGSIEEEAVAAIHSEQQAQVVASEIRHLAAKAGKPTRNMTAKVFRQRARMMLSRMSVKDAIRPNAFLEAERKSAKRAEDAFARVARGRDAGAALATAAKYKEQQLLNHYLYLESRDFTKIVDSKREKMRAYSKKSVREKLDGGYIEQIDFILDGYDFMVRSPGQVQRSESLRDFVERMAAEGRSGEISIDDRLLNEANRKHYTKLSVDELLGLFDTIENIDHMGRYKQRLIDAKEARDMDAIVSGIKAEIDANVSGHPPSRTSNAGEERKKLARDYLNTTLNADTLLREIDGFKDLGPTWSALKSKIDAGMHSLTERRVGMAKAFDGIYGVYTSKEKRDMAAKRHNESLGVSMSKWDLISLALNTGNQDNFERLTNPKVKGSFEAGAIQGALDGLTRRDWETVQAIWDYIDTFWGEIAAKEKRQTGVSPKKVEAKMMAVAPSFVRGGYYPIKYDARLSGLTDDLRQRDLAAELIGGRFSKAQTKNGHTKERATTTRQPVILDLAVAHSHVEQVLYDLELGEAVAGSWKILQDGRVRAAFAEKGKQSDYTALEIWLQDVASGERAAAGGIQSIMRHVRTGFTISRLALNVSTALIQPSGIAQSAVVVGKKAVAKGTVDYLSKPSRWVSDVLAVSPMMRERQKTFERDIFNAVGELEGGPITGRWSKFQRDVVLPLSFVMMQKVQFYAVDMPTWVSAYQKEVEASGDEARARVYADSMVKRAQGSGLMSDRGMLERGTLSKNSRQQEFPKMLTALGSYMFAKANVMYEQTAKTNFKSPAQVMSLAVDVVLLFTLEAALYSAVKGYLPDEDDDIEEWLLKETALSMMSTMPLTREFSGSLQGFNSGGIFGSIIDSLSKPMIQASQGEADKAFVKSLVDSGGVLFHLPASQSKAVIDGLFESDMSVRDDISPLRMLGLQSEHGKSIADLIFGQ